MPSSKFDFPNLAQVPEDVDLIAVGKFDLAGEEVFLTPGGAWPKMIESGSNWDTEVLIYAYKNGIFPMPLDAIEAPHVISWWSPNPRGVIEPAKIKISKSLQKSIQKFKFTINQDFELVMRYCADEKRSSRWITEEVIQAYLKLHKLGIAHSVEVRDKTGALIGGLYGVEVGGLFAGESMFHLQPDTSKAALVKLGQILLAAPDAEKRLIDCQWLTSHLETLGAVEITRSQYLDKLPGLVSIKSSAFGAQI